MQQVRRVRRFGSTVQRGRGLCIGRELDRVAAVSAATVFSGQASPDIREGLHPFIELGMVIHRDADGEGAHILLLHAEASYTSRSRDGLKISRA